MPSKRHIIELYLWGVLLAPFCIVGAIVAIVRATRGNDEHS